VAKRLVSFKLLAIHRAKVPIGSSQLPDALLWLKAVVVQYGIRDANYGDGTQNGTKNRCEETIPPRKAFNSARVVISAAI
jgi:hypothetical protein